MKLTDLWTVVFCDTERPVLPFDTNEHDDQGMLVYSSEDAAKASAEHQNQLYDLDCRACRLDKARLGDT